MSERNAGKTLMGVVAAIVLVGTVIAVLVFAPRPRGTQGAGSQGGQPSQSAGPVDTGPWKPYGAAVKLIVKAEDVKQLVGQMKLESDDDNDDVFTKDGRRAKVQFVTVPDATCGDKDDVTAHKAVFELKVEKSGTYYPWVRVWWLNGCGDSLAVVLQREGDEKPLALEVTDETHSRWLWRALAGPAGVELKEGTYKVTVENREDGARLSRILFAPRDYQSYMPTTPEG